VDDLPIVEITELGDPRHNAAVRGPVEITLKYSRLNEYQIASLKAIAMKLPRIINSVRDQQLESRLKFLVAAYQPHDDLSDMRAYIYEDALAYQRQIVQSFPMLDANGLAALATPSQLIDNRVVDQWKIEQRIFSIQYFGIELFPALQFKDGLPIPFISELLSILSGHLDEWEVMYWFISATSWLSGQAPIDCLQEPSERVVYAAQQHVAQLTD
jgi:hypothetical protein